jgi:hypothetical protein
VFLPLFFGVLTSVSSALINEEKRSRYLTLEVNHIIKSLDSHSKPTQHVVTKKSDCPSVGELVQ